MRQWLAFGAILGLVSVALGAFGAHGLRSLIDEAGLRTYQTGVQYHQLHAVGIVLAALGGLTRATDERLTRAACWAFTVGILFFSASLYGLALGGPRALGAVAPMGGAAFITGWGLFAWAALKSSRNGA